MPHERVAFDESNRDACLERTCGATRGRQETGVKSPDRALQPRRAHRS
jgi:hypothetical protein